MNSLLYDTRFAMSKEDFNIVASAIHGIISRNGIKKIKLHRDAVNFTKCQFTSFVWSMYHMVKPKIVGSYTDAQIESVLKRILQAYKEIR